MKKKKKNGIFFDFYNRDAPTIFDGKDIYIGNKGSSHATMIQEMFYGMDVNDGEDYYWIYYKKWNNENEEHLIDFSRDEIQEDMLVFGHLVGKCIYWDYYRITPYHLERLKEYNSEYTQFVINSDWQAVKLKEYRM